MSLRLTLATSCRRWLGGCRALMAYDSAPAAASRIMAWTWPLAPFVPQRTAAYVDQACSLGWCLAVARNQLLIRGYINRWTSRLRSSQCERRLISQRGNILFVAAHYHEEDLFCQDAGSPYLQQVSGSGIQGAAVCRAATARGGRRHRARPRPRQPSAVPARAMASATTSSPISICAFLGLDVCAGGCHGPRTCGSILSCTSSHEVPMSCYTTTSHTCPGKSLRGHIQTILWCCRDACRRPACARHLGRPEAEGDAGRVSRGRQERSTSWMRHACFC